MEFDKHSLDFSSQQDCSDICRLCLGHSKLQPLSISKFAADFDNYNFVEIPLGFNLPENMCLECIGELDRIALFIEKCKNSHVVLKQIEKKCDTVCNSDVKIEFFDDSNEELKYCSDSITEVKNIENVASSSSLNYALKESGLKKEVDQFEQSEEYSLDREIKSEYTRMVSSDSSDESDSIDNLASLSTHTASNSQDADIVEKCDNCGVTDTKMANRYQMSKCCCPKDYKCPTCNLTFKNKSGLTNHQADCRLSDVSPTHFMCPEKGKQFISEVCGKELKIPEKSKRQYEKCYSDFRDWCNKKNVETVSENVVLTYLLEKSKILKSASLWSTYSMLKLMLNIRDGIDVTKFLKLVPFLKKKSVGYQAKKSQVLTREQINLFLEKASDENYLLWKVILIMGISGAMRRDELTKMSIDDIRDENSVLIVTVPDTKTGTKRTFIVTNPDFIRLYRKYAALRPKNVANRRVFCRYKNGKCNAQVVGVHKIGEIPSLIAKYLGLPNSKEYTGHCFRRSSATFLANSGA